MSKLVESATVIEAAGNKPKKIMEFIGRVNTGSSEISIARMKSPEGWLEPGQTPEFNEYTVVLKGMVRVETETRVFDVTEGQSFIAYKGEWVRYSTPEINGAEYIAVCMPAFSPETVNRDE